MGRVFACFPGATASLGRTGGPKLAPAHRGPLSSNLFLRRRRPGSAMGARGCRRCSWGCPATGKAWWARSPDGAASQPARQRATSAACERFLWKPSFSLAKFNFECPSGRRLAPARHLCLAQAHARRPAGETPAALPAGWLACGRLAGPTASQPASRRPPRDRKLARPRGYMLQNLQLERSMAQRGGGRSCAASSRVSRAARLYQLASSRRQPRATRVGGAHRLSCGPSGRPAGQRLGATQRLGAGGAAGPA